MDNSIKPQSPLKDSTKVALFLAYSSLGIAGAGYFTFNVIKKRNQMELGQKLTPLARRQLVWKYGKIGFLLSFSYLISIGYFLSKIRPMQMMFKMATDKNHEYNEKIKGDPVFQQYYIFKTLEFFKVSPQLVEKTHEELKIITEQKQKSGESAQDKYIDFDRQLLQLLMKRQKKFKLGM